MLQEVEDLISRKTRQTTAINFITDKLLHKLEKLGNQVVQVEDEAETSNIMVQYGVLRILDIVLRCRLIATEHMPTSSLIYLVNSVFLLHDVFVGTTLARRMVERSKEILL